MLLKAFLKIIFKLNRLVEVKSSKSTEKPGHYSIVTRIKTYLNCFSFDLICLGKLVILEQCIKETALWMD